MKCHQCQQAIPDGEDHDHAGKIFCEDCYIDILSPTRFCDPWADFSARSFEKNNPEISLTKTQKTLLNLIRVMGKAEPFELIEQSEGRISPADGERECATLLRLGKIRIENSEGKTIIRAV